MTPLSGWVLDTDEARNKVSAWAKEGLLHRVTIQVTAWPHAEKNRGVFTLWKAVLNQLGVAVAATVLGTGDDEADVATIAELRAKLKPDAWTLDLEDSGNPAASYVGHNCAKLMAATRPEPVWISYNGLAEQMGYDFRRWSQRGATVFCQCYGPNGEPPWEGWPYPAGAVRSVFRPKVCWASTPDSPAWWYRIRMGARVKWAQVVGYNPDVGMLEMRTAKGATYWAVGWPVGGHLEFAPSRFLHAADRGTRVGYVDGFATYPKIGVNLATTRPYTPEQLGTLAASARLSPRGVVPIDVYTLDNASTDQIRAMAEA